MLFLNLFRKDGETKNEIRLSNVQLSSLALGGNPIVSATSQPHYLPPFNSTTEYVSCKYSKGVDNILKKQERI